MGAFLVLLVIGGVTLPVVRGITRQDEAFAGASGPKESVVVGEVLTVYGKEEDIRRIVNLDKKEADEQGEGTG